MGMVVGWQSNKPSVDNLKNISRKLDRCKDIGQHESNIMRRGEPVFAMIAGEFLTNRMDLSLKNAAKKRWLPAVRLFLVSLRWLLPVRVFQTKSF